MWPPTYAAVSVGALTDVESEEPHAYPRLRRVKAFHPAGGDARRFIATRASAPTEVGGSIMLAAPLRCPSALSPTTLTLRDLAVAGIHARL